MKKRLPHILLSLIILGIVSWFVYLIGRVNLQVLRPSGLIADQESDLIVLSMGIMLAIAIPVVLATYFVAWKYRASSKSNYAPDWMGNNWVKLLYWGFLGTLVVVFSVIVWEASHRLDPYKPIDSTTKPLKIQVVALQWKWLFIYPEQNIASVNFFQFPVNTPLEFYLTADAPMNSFWIPALGSQIYAMAAMETKLHLLANKIGDFPGGSAEISGHGFAGMRFTARSSTASDFDLWVSQMQSSSNPLTRSGFESLAKPSDDAPVAYYSSVEEGLYKSIMMKYMTPPEKNHEIDEADGH